MKQDGGAFSWQWGLVAWGLIWSVGAAISGDVRVPLELAPGEHRLVVLVEDVGGSAAFGARLTDATNGAPPARLSAWAEPPAERRR